MVAATTAVVAEEATIAPVAPALQAAPPLTVHPRAAAPPQDPGEVAGIFTKNFGYLSALITTPNAETAAVTLALGMLTTEISADSSILSYSPPTQTAAGAMAAISPTPTRSVLTPTDLESETPTVDSTDAPGTRTTSISAVTLTQTGSRLLKCAVPAEEVHTQCTDLRARSGRQAD